MDAVRQGASTRLQWEGRSLTTAQLQMLLAGCDRLTILEVEHDSSDSELVGEILRSLPRLERLKLTGPVEDSLLRAIATVPSLKILNLPGGQFGDDAFASLAEHPQLELLRFHSSQVTDAGLSSVTMIPKLRFLHLIDVPVTDVGLRHLHGLTQLESFYLDGGHCTEEGLSELIRQLPKLHFHWNDLHLPDDPRKHPHP